MISFRTVAVLIVVILGVHACYPKWTKDKTEATLSWDVSGYYMYLPAFFIYKDLKKCSFKEAILEKYKPTPNFQQAYLHQPSGNYVMKYSMGQAVQFTPFFLIAHFWAKNSVYPADGFSFPYQFMISLWSLLVAIIGLLLLRKILLEYFEDKIVAATIAVIVLGSNYLNYVAIDGAMTHNGLFALYTLLIYVTIRFYKRPSLGLVLLIGAIVGLAALTRPTEILSCLIPLLWGLNPFDSEKVRRRIAFVKEHLRSMGAAVGTCAIVGFLQLCYWKYATGSWIVYSYQDQGFDWLHPHLIDGIFSYKSGWLTYSPMMVFSLLGFIWCYQKRKDIFLGAVVFVAAFIYVSFAWSIWWYGGSLGQRTLVQCYAVLSFPMACFIQFSSSYAKLFRFVVLPVFVLFIYVNLWFTYQAHLGTSLIPGKMTKAYYWATVGRLKAEPENIKLLDTDELHYGLREEVLLLYSGESEVRELNAEKQEVVLVELEIGDNLAEGKRFSWYRASALFKTGRKEWDHWKMSCMYVRFRAKGQVVKQRLLRIQRHLGGSAFKELYLDISLPSQEVDTIEVVLSNGGSTKKLFFKEFKLEGFE